MKNGELKPPSITLTVASGLIVAIVMFWLTNLTGQMHEFEKGATERTAKIVGLETSQEYTNKKLDSMEHKLDVVINKIDQHMMDGRK